MNMIHKLLISYIMLPFLIINFYDAKLYKNLSNIMKIFIIYFNSSVLYFFTKKNNCQKNVLFIYYVSFINIYSVILSFVTNNYKFLLLIRYISWLYTCPYMIQYKVFMKLNNINDLFDNYNNKLFIFLVLILIINIIHYLYMYNVLLYLKYVLSIIYIYIINYYKYELSDDFILILNIISLMYGIFQLLYDLELIDTEKIYYIYSLFDVFTKFTFIFLKDIKNDVFNLNLSFKTLKVIKMIEPTVKKALLNNIIDKEEYDNFFKKYNINDSNIEIMQKDYLKEIFPDSKSFNNIFNNNELFIIMDDMIILFCDMVKYTEFVNNNTFDVVIPYINNYFCKIDYLVEKYNITKVEIIGDAYLMISKNIDDIVSCALELKNKFNKKIRIGIHVGNIARCNIGITKMRSSYIGPGINFAARLESTSKPGKIHISKEIVTIINSNYKKFNYKYNIKKRKELIELKGIGKYETYFIE